MLLFAPRAGLAALVLAAGCLSVTTVGCGRGASTEDRLPSVLLVTLDTTRADHLSVYEYERRTTPNLDRFATEAVLYTRAWSTSSWTLPAHASIFTGLFPAAHGAHFDVGGALRIGPVRAGALAESFVTIAELLDARGYRTGAVVAGPWLKRPFGLMQGFAFVDDAVADLTGRRADEVTDVAVAWLDHVGDARPVLLFVNYFDPHAPYDPPPGFDTYPSARRSLPEALNWHALLAGRRHLAPAEVATIVDRYDGEIRAMDHELGRLMRVFGRREDGDRALVVVAGDHGESFGEEGRWRHNTALSEEQLRVPLLVRYPDWRGAGTRQDAPVQLPDVFALIARETGIEVPPGVQGVLPGERSHAFAELYRNSAHLERHGDRFDRDLASVIDWPFKLVVSDRGDRRLFRLDEFREEEATASGAGEIERLAALLAEHEARMGRAETRPARVDAETLESLRALGYAE